MAVKTFKEFRVEWYGKFGRAPGTEDVWDAATKAASVLICPGMDKCKNLGVCERCVRHPALQDKWAAIEP